MLDKACGNLISASNHIFRIHINRLEHEYCHSEITCNLPTNTAPVPVILFSHGLGGNREGSKFLGEHWAARGYVAVFLQHPGSDDSVWKGKPSRTL